MKKFLNLLVILIIIFSCSSDDDAGETNQDPIVGKWYLYDLRINGTSVVSDNCVYLSFVQLNEDHSSNNAYFQNDGSGCTQTPTDSPDWSNLGEGLYRFEVPMFGLQTGEVEFIGDDEFDFTSEAFPSGTVVTFSIDKRD